MNSIIVEQITNWYNMLDPLDRKDVDVLLSMEAYGIVFDKYHTAPDFPTCSTVLFSFGENGSRGETEATINAAKER